MVTLLLFALLIFSSCAGNYHGNGMISIELNFPPDQSPLDGAEIITLSIWSGNEQIATRDFPLDSRVGTIEGVPQNIPIRAIVEAKSREGVLISKGRTPEFILEKDQKKQLKIFFSRIGSFSKLRKEMGARIEAAVSPIADNLILVTGGRSPSGEYLSSSEVYYHNELSFKPSGNMNKPRTGHSLVRLNDGRIAILCGEDGSSVLPDIEIFEIDSGLFTTVQRLNIPRKKATATVINDGTVLICGGVGATSALNTCEVFNPLDNTVELLGLRMNNFRYNHSALPLPDGTVLLAGGNGFNSLEIFNIDNGTHPISSPLSSERENFYMEYLDSQKIIFACGEKQAGIDILKLSDFSISYSQEAVILPAECSAQIMLDGRLFVAGGLENNLPTDSAFIINLNTYQIEWSGKMLAKRRTPDIELLPDGTLLILGGTDSPPFAEIFNPP